MSEQTNDDSTGENDGEGQGRQWRKELETRASTAEQERDALKRELAFSKVKGLDPENPQHEYFRTTYTGKADAAAIREEAIKAGFIVDEQAATDKESVEQETRFNEASTDALPADVSTDQAEKLKAIQNAKSQKEWAAAVKAAGLMGSAG